MVVLFAEADDDGAPVSGAHLSRSLGCIAFSAGVHDDDIFCFQVHRDGEEVTGGAIPDPNLYFGITPEMMEGLDPAMLEEMGAPSPSTENAVPDAGALARAIGDADETALRAAFDADFVFASERHSAVVQALGLPPGAVGWGYRYLLKGRSDWSGPAITEF